MTYDVAATISLRTEAGSCTYNLRDKVHADAFVQELLDHIDGSYGPDEFDGEAENAWLTVEVKKRPEGFVASLPEFDGW